MKKINLLLIITILTLISCQNNTKEKVINTTCSTNFYETTSSIRDSSTGKIRHLSTAEIPIKGFNKYNGTMSIKSNIMEDYDGYYFYFNIYSKDFEVLKSNVEIHISDKTGKIIKLEAQGGSSKKYYTNINGKDGKKIKLLKSTLIKKIEIFDTSKNKKIYKKELTFNESGKVNELFNCIYQMKNSNEI